jgi:uncharacterized protein (DUF362 family)
MFELTRREILRLLTKSAAVLGLSGVMAEGLGGPGSAAQINAVLKEAQSGQSESSGLSGRSIVTVIRGDDLRRMARESLDSVGGAKSLIQPGQTVFIKPNLVTAQGAAFRPVTRNGECTKPEIVITVAEECLKAGAAEVIIGEGAHAPRFSWQAIKTMDGLTNMASEAEGLNAKYKGKVRLVCLNAETPEWVEVPTRTSLGKIAISSLVTRADIVISIPVIKTHDNAAVSLSMKNFIGTISNDRHGGYPVRKDIHRAGLEQSFIDVVASIKPHLAIIDGSICCEGNGPTVDPSQGRGRTVDMKERSGSWMLLASKDLAAADATAARLISHDVSRIKQFQLAANQGLGEIREERIEVRGGKLDELRVPWLPAQLKTIP